MKKSFLILTFLSVFVSSSYANNESTNSSLLTTNQISISPTEIVKNESNFIFEELEKSSNVIEFKSKINNKITNLFDFDTITNRTLGKHSRIANDLQKKEISKEFKFLLINLYSNALFEFKSNDMSLDIKKEIYNEDEVQIKSIAILKGKQVQRIPFDYTLLKVNNQWKLIDLSIENMSLVLSYKTQFNEIISKKGIDGLIEELKSKNSKIK